MYTPEQKRKFASKLRKNLTPAEQLLWDKIAGAQLGHTFAKQVILHGFIVDFYCRKLKIAIELDGGSHIGREKYDRMREQYLKAKGIIIMRFPNLEVYKRIDTVLDTIRRMCTTIDRNSPGRAVQERKTKERRMKQRARAKKL